MTAKLLHRLRVFALSLPGTSEVPSWGHPNFRAGKKTFAVYELYKGRPCVAVKLPRPDGQALLGDPRFFVTPYIGKQGWVSLWVDEPVPWPLVRDLALRSYREVAAGALLAELEARPLRSPRKRRIRAPSSTPARRATRARAKVRGRAG
jgi:predicted DNA-binding protein (MmcQ/YjbR family)